MTTVSTLVTRTLKDLGVINAAESASTGELADGMAALNDMISTWQGQGADLEFLEFTSTADVIPYSTADVAAMRWNLSLVLAPSFGKQISPEIAKLAQDGYHAIQASYNKPGLLSVDRALHPYVSDLSHLFET